MGKLNQWRKYPEYINSEVTANKFPHKSLHYRVVIPKKGLNPSNYSTLVSPRNKFSPNSRHSPKCHPCIAR